jgi:hypothetical protein
VDHAIGDLEAAVRAVLADTVGVAVLVRVQSPQQPGVLVCQGSQPVQPAQDLDPGPVRRNLVL